MQDWISKYIEVTEGIPAPEIFRLWAAISTVAGAMERRFWVVTALGTLYPNLYIMLVAPPGVGKTEAMRPAKSILKTANYLNLAPPSMTKAAVVDTLREAGRRMIFPSTGKILDYHTLQIFVSEISTFIHQHDHEFLGLINDIFDNNDNFRERRRHVNGGKEIHIPNPQFNILIGAQPALLGSILPEEAWLQGTTSRFIMVFAGDAPKPDLFGPIINRENAYKELLDQLNPWTEMYGQFKWNDNAIAPMKAYYADNLKPVPQHPKLITYCNRRIQYLIKLSAISALSRTSDIIIDQYDVERARFWLLQAESTMENIFNNMSLKSDAQLLEELHIFVYSIYRKDRKLLHESILHEFLSTRVYAERISRIIELAKKSALLEDKGGGMFIPKPRLDLGQKILQK